MITRRNVLPLIGATLLLPMAGARAESAPDFAPGQVWSIKSAEPTTTRVIVGRIGTWPQGVAVHVSVVDIPVPNDFPVDGGTVTAAHMPFDKAALASSVDQLLATDGTPAPGFEEGYADWSDNHGSVFIASVDTTVALLLNQIREQLPDEQRNHA